MTDGFPLLDPARLIGLGVIGVLTGAAALDFYLELKNFPPLGSQIKEWAKRYPGFMAFLAL